MELGARPGRVAAAMREHIDECVVGERRICGSPVRDVHHPVMFEQLHRVMTESRMEIVESARWRGVRADLEDARRWRGRVSSIADRGQRAASKDQYCRDDVLEHDEPRW